MKKNILFSRSRMAWIVGAAALLLCAGVVWSYWPSSRKQMERSVAFVEYKCFYRVSVNGRPVLYFNKLDSDSTLVGVHLSPREASVTGYTAGCWIHRFSLVPSCYGRIVAAIPSMSSKATMQMVEKNFASIIMKNKALVQEQLKDLTKESAEMKYYLRVHSVQDEGYNFISAYAQKLYAGRDSAAKVLEVMNKVDSVKHVQVAFVKDFTVVYRDKNGKQQRTHCHVDKRAKIQGLVVLQTDDGSTPPGVVAQHFRHLLPWPAGKGSQIFAAGIIGLHEDGFDMLHANGRITPGVLAGRLGRTAAHNVPAILSQSGAPVFSENGFFLGINLNGKVVR